MKYKTIIPRCPSAPSAFTLFSKEKSKALLSQWEGEKLSKSEEKEYISDCWKKLSDRESLLYKERAEEEKKRIRHKLNKESGARDEVRKEWCKKLNISKSSSWEEIDAANRKIWELDHGVDGGNGKGKKSRGDGSDSDDSDAASSDDEKPSKKKKRKESEKAISKMKKQKAGDSDDDESSDESSDEINASMKKLKNKSGKTTTKSSGGGMLSGTASMVKSGSSKQSSGLRKRVSRLGDTEWESALWAEERVKAVTRAIDRIYEMSLDQDNFDLFGNDMIQCFYDVATVTGEPIRRKTLKYVEYLANRWKYTIMQEGWKDPDQPPTPSDVIEVITGMYCMERVGIRHDLKAEVLQFINSDKAFSAKDYFGWNPKKEFISEKGGLEVISNAHVSRYRLMSSTLIHSFFADRVGFELGCPYSDIFQWLPKLRPYKGPTELSWQEYIDQCYLVTHIIFTANNWGELSLHPSLFPHEYYFLRAHLDIHLYQRDVHLISEFVESLRCFGCQDDDPLIQRGMRALLDLQSDGGIWDYTPDEPYRTYHATMCGAQALLAHRYRGFGPGIASIVPLLLQWSEEDVKNNDFFNSEYQKKVEEAGKVNFSIRQERSKLNESIGLAGSKKAQDISAPDDITKHTEERTSALKAAIRVFAKSWHSVDPNKSSESTTQKDANGSTPTTTGDNRDPSQAILVELASTLSTYMSPKTEVTPALEEKVLSSLSKAQALTINSSILESHVSMAKSLRQLSRGKFKAPGTSAAAIVEAAVKVMSSWKEQMSAEIQGPETPRAVDASTPAAFPASVPIVEAEETSILNIDVPPTTDMQIDNANEDELMKAELTDSPTDNKQNLPGGVDGVVDMDIDGIATTGTEIMDVPSNIFENENLEVN